MDRYTRFDNKRILIWGYGREGKSTEMFLKECCSPKSVEIFEGKRDGFDIEKYDYVIKSPGIILQEDDARFTSQTDIFLECFRDKTIGVTGTKGKSTTSTMLYHVLKDCLDKRVLLLGNIGEPCLNYFTQIDDNTIVVFEMSCHQLAKAVYSPHISVFLNLFEEHLDYYKTFERYFAAKQNITKNQTSEDFFYVGDQVPDINTDATKIIIKRNDTPHYELKVLGAHNDYNAYVTERIVHERYGVEYDAIRSSLSSFVGLAHRLQFIGEKDGIRYYDDSISTIPNATIEALTSVPGAYSVIIGGMDRGIDYEVLIEYILEHNEFFYIFCYESGKRIFDAVGEGDNRVYCSDLEKAVLIAKEHTPSGKACVLSPASASYGYFKNFEHRGDMFKEYIGIS